MSISERIKIVFKETKTRPVEFANKVNKTSQYVYHLMNSKKGVGISAVELILKHFPQVSARWLILGEGNIFINPKNILKDPIVSYGKDPEASLITNEALNQLKKQIDIKDKQIESLLDILKGK